MSSWLDIALVAAAVLASAVYAAYALGPRRLRDSYSKLATKYLGLRAARWFSSNGSGGTHGCHECSANTAHSVDNKRT